MAGIMGSKSFVILSGVLLAQAGLFYGFSRKDFIPQRLPLADFYIDRDALEECQRVGNQPRTN